jgi:hypothetical protein
LFARRDKQTTYQYYSGFETLKAKVVNDEPLTFDDDISQQAKSLVVGLVIVSLLIITIINNQNIDV